MNDIYNLFFQHSDTTQGLMIDTVIFFGLILCVCVIVENVIYFGGRRH